MKGCVEMATERDPCGHVKGDPPVSVNRSIDVLLDSPWRRSPLHSSSDASRLTALFVGCVCPILNMRPPHALSAGRLAALGATRDSTTGC